MTKTEGIFERRALVDVSNSKTKSHLRDAALMRQRGTTN